MIPRYVGQSIELIIRAEERQDWRKTEIYAAVAKVFICAIVCAYASSCPGACFILLGARASVRLRSRLMRHLFRQEVGFFDTTETGDLTSRLTQDVQKVVDTIELNINVMLRTSVQALVTVVFMFWISVELTLVAMISVPVDRIQTTASCTYGAL